MLFIFPTSLQSLKVIADHVHYERNTNLKCHHLCACNARRLEKSVYWYL